MSKEMENEMNERLRMFLKERRLTQKKFCETIGLSLDSLKTLLKENRCMRTETLADVVRKYPELDIKWLLIGETTHIKDADSEITAPDKDARNLEKENYILLRENRQLRIKIDELTAQLDSLKKNKVVENEIVTFFI